MRCFFLQLAGIIFVLLGYAVEPTCATTFVTLSHPLATFGTELHGISGNQIVGSYSSPSVHGLLYSGSTWTTLDDPLAVGGSQHATSANGVSGNTIVGYYFSGNSNLPHHGFLFDGTTWTTLDHPQAAEISPFLGTEINGIDGGNLVGTFSNFGDSHGINHGFLYDGSTWTTLDAPLASSSYGTWAQGISGDKVVGYYADSAGNSHGFLYNDGSWTTLDYPQAGARTVAMGIAGNNIVGYYYQPGQTVHGFLYDGATWKTLDVPLAGGATGGASYGTYVTGISGDTIVGYYNDQTQYRTTFGFVAQIPEPSSLVLISLGACGVCCWRATQRQRRRKPRADDKVCDH